MASTTLASIRTFAASLAPAAAPSTASPQAPSNQTTVAPSTCSLRREMWARLKNGGLAALITCLAQLLLTLVQRLLDETHVDFPASIVAMAIVFGVFSIAGHFFPSVNTFYQNHLRCPADLLNRHMSIGFTIPFVMICRNPLASPQTIGLIIACFLLTGIINTLTAYALALPLQALMGRLDFIWKKTDASAALFCKAASYNKEKKAAQCVTVKEAVPAQVSERSGVVGWAIRNPMLILSWLLTIFVGLPLRFQAQHDAFLSASLLFAIWFTTLAIQASFKTNPPSYRPWLSTALFGLSNAVLWTSLLMIAYVFAEAATTQRSLHAMLDTLQTNVTITSLVFPTAAAATAPAHTYLAAGDIALCILNAGLVSWGLKLYEYRRQLVSRAGLTVLAVSSLLAAGNVALGPLLARALGLRSAPTDLAFAARSVTLALGSPVMVALGGDVGINAAMVVMSGIVFQVGLGFGVGGWLERNLVERCLPAPRPAAAPVSDGGYTSDGGAVTSTARSSVTLQGTDDEGLDLEAQVLALAPEATTTSKCDSTPRTVASGVTIGINAAAMGTAYLYEVKSEAAPYSALSMMAMGIMTVVFASIPSLQTWLVGAVASAV
ncbi:hypothetical protein QBC39DRAFT_328866 [Podospora conica]|nr:hypothetical protein QBC39DRAFT_328866 [Schizothecium conicum]